MLFKYQSGIRSNYSLVISLSYHSNHFLLIMETGKDMGVIFIDTQKVFNSLHQETTVIGVLNRPQMTENSL